MPRKKKRKPVRFRQISFKLTEGQKTALDRYCTAYKTTPVRFIKSLVNSHVERYRPESPPQSFVTENQLPLFEEEA